MALATIFSIRLFPVGGQRAREFDIYYSDGDNKWSIVSAKQNKNANSLAQLIVVLILGEIVRRFSDGP